MLFKYDNGMEVKRLDLKFIRGTKFVIQTQSNQINKITAVTINVMTAE